MTPAQLAIARALKAASDGVEFRAGRGAYCPVCGAKLKAYNTQPWREGVRVRYHHCAAPDCILARLGKTVKSVEDASASHPRRAGRPRREAT